MTDMETDYVIGTLKSEDEELPGAKRRHQMSQRPTEPEGGKHRNQANARERDRTQRWAEVAGRHISTVAASSAYFAYFEKRKKKKKKEGLMRSACCSCTHPINFSMAEPMFIKFGMHMMAPEPIHKSIPSARVSVRVSPSSCYVKARQKRYRDNEYTRKNRIVGRFILYAVRIASKKAGDYSSSQSFLLAYFP